MQHLSTPVDGKVQELNEGQQQREAFDFIQDQFHAERTVQMSAFARPPSSVTSLPGDPFRVPQQPFQVRPGFPTPSGFHFSQPLSNTTTGAHKTSNLLQQMNVSSHSDHHTNSAGGNMLQLCGTAFPLAQPLVPTSYTDGSIATTTDNQTNTISSTKRRHRFSTRKIIGVMEFRCLLREALLLNEQLKNYYQKHFGSSCQDSLSAAELESHINDSNPVTDQSDHLSSTSSSQNDVMSSDVVSQSSVVQPADSEDNNILLINSHDKRTVRLGSHLEKVEHNGESGIPTKTEDVDCTLIKKRLNELRKLLTEAASNVQLRLRRISQKRKRIKRLRQQLYEEKREMESRRQKRHQELEKWENEMRLQAANAKMELEMKKAADATLSEVRRKISDVHHRLTLLGKLRKLRDLRRDQAERKGTATSKSADGKFEERVGALTAFLKEQLSDYEAEQRTLQVMLETEQEETKEKEREKRKEKMEERLNKYEQQLHQWLFGRNDPLPPSDPVFPYRQYYELASYSTDALVKIRQEWDMFLVPRGLPGGSSLPQGWVVPVEPTDDVWASALKQ
jgi:uncharacterized glyoxalase superfamily protein PhnB